MSGPDEETKALQASIFWSKVRRAREAPEGEKLMEGPRLFDVVAGRMRSGIRADHPEFNEEQVWAEFSRRLAVLKRISDAGHYRDAGLIDG